MIKPREIILGVGAIALLAGAGWWVWKESFAVWNRPEVVQVLPQAKVVRHAVVVRSGSEAPKVMTANFSYAGAPSLVACATCHSTREPKVETRAGDELDEFHQGLRYAHGGQSCLSCHNAGNYDTLRKADGSAVAFPRVVELCAQCHGPQFRDYTNGTHGGMNGHWDLTRGPRTRNTCTDCHDAHAPAYPQLMPVFAPKDRGALQQKERAESHAAETTEASANGGHSHD